VRQRDGSARGRPHHHRGRRNAHPARTSQGQRRHAQYSGSGRLGFAAAPLQRRKRHCVWRGSSLPEATGSQGGKWENRWFRLYEQTGYPLTLTVYAGADICLQIEYDRNRFEGDVIQRMLYHLATILQAMPQAAEQRLQELPMLTAGELQQVTAGWNQTQQEYPREALHRLFEAHVRRAPDAIAVTDNGVSLTYRQLNERANQLAHYLRRSGVKADVLVGICLERSLDMVVATLGVLKAGGAYVPLDPAFPKERLAIIVEDTQAGVLVTRRELISILPLGAETVVYITIQRWSSKGVKTPTTKSRPATWLMSCSPRDRPAAPKGYRSNTARW
jgi:non-ribosomal peptide synthetase component F